MELHPSRKSNNGGFWEDHMVFSGGGGVQESLTQIKGGTIEN